MQELDNGDSGKLHLDKGKWCVFSAATVQQFTSVPEAQLVIEATTVDFVMHTLMQVCLFVSLFLSVLCLWLCVFYVVSYHCQVRSSCRRCACLVVFWLGFLLFLHSWRHSCGDGVRSCVHQSTHLSNKTKQKTHAHAHLCNFPVACDRWRAQ